MGPMAVRNNRFVAMDVLADLADNLTDAADAYVGGVYLVNHGLPGYFAGWLSALGFKGLQEGFAAQGPPMERLAVGRASCRERVCQDVKLSGVAVTINKKKQ